MRGVFQVLVNGKLETYSSYYDIPKVIDNVIKFMPEIPPSPHTDEQHEEMETWDDKLKELLARETK